jgi:hypothetical protein
VGFGAINIENIGGVLSGAGTLLKDLRTAITGKAPLDPTRLAELEAKTLEIEQGIVNAQAKINEIEAASSSIFVAGWRPAAGWLTVCGLAWATFVVPIWAWISSLCKIPLPPVIDTGILVSLLIGMLGLGAYRTYEKKQGIQGDH